MKVIALLAALSLPAQAQLWHADVAPPKPGLPAVSVDVGYPAMYAPPRNCPIALHARGGSLRFDGYIGYYFEVAGRGTLDTPVIARAVIQPHASWRFDTITMMRRWAGTAESSARPRELVIEWRDASMKRIASKSAGVPSWSSTMPLRIGPAPASAFGERAFVLAPAALSDLGQWYGGFTKVIAPLDVWIALPRPVRDAILGSGVHIVLIGFPRANQNLDDLDRAVLPVVFNGNPGSYKRPWPYAQATVQTPMSWRAKDGADLAGSYLVSTFASTWAPDDEALTHPLPAMARKDGPPAVIEDPSDTPHDYRSATYSGAMLLLSGIAWFFMRKRSLLLIGGAVILAIVIVAALEIRRTRLPAGTIDRTLRVAVAPNIVDEVHLLHDRGPAPLPEHRADRAGLSGDFGFPEDAELRGSQTAPSMGVLNHGIDYDWTMRWTYRRQVAPAASPENYFQAQLSDFHDGVSFRGVRRPRRGTFEINTFVSAPKDAWASCSFGLPPDTHGSAQVTVSGHLVNDEIRLTWASGSAKLAATKKDVYTPSTAVIPAEVLRGIVAGGGIFEVTATPSPNDVGTGQRWFSVRVQEKKS
ncbi:MAG TPA: hypothetical protein VJ853_03555 [Thermoanaerobaculia bacterium]|nr:hypothetical protein [Thermoanaerobaculia bacterium]